MLHVRGGSFRSAVEFLADQADTLPRSPQAPPPEPRPAWRLPQPADRHWPAVREFLTRSRCLCPYLIDRCHRHGLLYADARRNAVFLCRDRCQRSVGAELVGTRPDSRGRTFRGMAPGSRKALGSFWLPAPIHELGAVLIVESAVDALSALLLLRDSLPPHTLIASTAGVAPRLPRWLRDLRPPQTLCAYDSDTAGERAADSLLRNTPNACRLSPAGAKDWNDQLRADRQP